MPPSDQCLRAATIDLPTIWVRSVPTTKFIGMPRAKSAGPGQEAAAHAEKSAKNPDHETERD